ncbi:MAG: DEAD/DEAH box helicase [Candidatus Helarchaeota archaeon]|nr:DEAD/DEAH box helicase [Candidatus Helarchaeota archaeon]
MNLTIFDQFLPKLKKVIEKQGFLTPTKTQTAVFNHIRNKKNTLLVAPTGSGKTEAVIFPVFDYFLRHRQKTTGINILYITPLRALNRDIFRRLIDLGNEKEIKIKINVRHGDTSQYERRKQLLNPPDMLIITPETLQAILPAPKFKEHLKTIEWVIIDEIHELVDSKRGSQLSVALERLEELTKKEFTRFGLSATIGSPQKVATFLVGNRDVEVVNLEFEKQYEFKIEYPKILESDKKMAQTLNCKVEMASRIRRLMELIEAHKSTLIFVNTRQEAEVLASLLTHLKPNFTFGVHHGSLSKSVRIEAENRFKNNEIKALISTSSMELGIDVGFIDLVVQFRSPKQVTRLIQRVGRAGHKIGEISKGILLTTNVDDICESYIIVKKALKHELEEIKIHENALDVLAHQVVGILRDKGSTTARVIFSIIKRSYIYRNLSKSKFKELLEFLKSQNVIWEENNFNLIKPRRGMFQYYFNALSMIPDTKKFKIINSTTKRIIGTLDDKFVAVSGRVGSLFIMRGKSWKIISVDDEEEKIIVGEKYKESSEIPRWLGEQIPVPFTIADEVGKLRRKIQTVLKSNENINQSFEDLIIDSDAISEIKLLFQKQISEKADIGTDQTIVTECFDNYLIIHACFGLKENETLARVIGALLETRFRVNIGLRVDPYRIILIFPFEFAHPNIIEESIMETNPEHLESILEITLKNTNLFRYKFYQIARKFNVIAKKVSFKSLNMKGLVKIFQNTPLYEETMRDLGLEKINLAITKKIFQKIHNGEIKIKEIIRSKTKGPTPFGLAGLEWLIPKDFILTKSTKGIILDTIKKRLLNTQKKLFCMYCKKWERINTISLLPEKPECPKCGSRFLAVSHFANTELKKSINLQQRNQKLSKEEKKIIQTAQKSANLVLNYGRKAIIVLAARGVGPTTTIRILEKNYDSKDEEELFLDILEAERRFERTRQFWDSK